MVHTRLLLCQQGRKKYGPSGSRRPNLAALRPCYLIFHVLKLAYTPAFHFVSPKHCRNKDPGRVSSAQRLFSEQRRWEYNRAACGECL